jgi:hypothetical protein
VQKKRKERKMYEKKKEVKRDGKNVSKVNGCKSQNFKSRSNVKGS